MAFSADGTVRWTAGRVGAGPGELDNGIANPGDIAVSGNGTLAVLTQESTRLDLWTGAGAYLGRRSLVEGGLAVNGWRSGR